MAKEHYTETAQIIENNNLFVETKKYDVDGNIIEQSKRPCTDDEVSSYKITQLSLSDTGLQRLAEDIWEVLKKKGLVNDGDLSNIVTGRINNKKLIRDINEQ